MGQYHYVVNLTKHQFLHPHQLGDGIKLMEFGNSAGGTMTALALLLACSNGRGGGDFRGEDPEQVVGAWAGDQIAIIGDYSEDSDLAAPFAAPAIYAACEEGAYVDVSPVLRLLIEQDGMFRFTKRQYGWERKEVS